MASMTDGYVRIFDTTLRDGEQCPGATMTSAEKLEVARALARLGVDVIEAGFPAASPDDFAGGALHRADRRRTRRRRPPVERAADHLRPREGEPRRHRSRLARRSSRPRARAVHLFLATSELHMKHKLRHERADVLRRVERDGRVHEGAAARRRVQPRGRGAQRVRRSSTRCSTRAIRAGATTLNIPDTVGYTHARRVRRAHPRHPRPACPAPGTSSSRSTATTTSGLATANTLAGILAGARQAEVTINGIGERAGNTSLEEVVMALATRRRSSACRPGIDTTQLYR